MGILTSVGMLLLITAVVAYFCGCINGAIIVSRFFCRDDVREHGSGNAGLTNFYRSYGAQYALFVIAVDMLKMVLSVVVALALSSFVGWPLIFKLWAGLFCVIGHMFPVTYKFKGGKGILSSGMLLWLIDWRVAAVAWGVFIALCVLTRYVSLGSICCSLTVPVTLFVFYPGNWAAILLGSLIAALVVYAHRGNLKRLLNGTESKFRFHKKGVDSK